MHRTDQFSRSAASQPHSELDSHSAARRAEISDAPWWAITSRSSFVPVVAVLYLFPILMLSVYALSRGVPGSWLMFSFGLVLACVGSAILLTLLSRWERTLNMPFEECTQYKKELEVLSQQKKQLQAELENVQQELSKSIDQLKIKEHVIKHQYETLEEQQATIAGLKDQAEAFEEKERELHYEIKALLQMAYTAERV